MPRASAVWSETVERYATTACLARITVAQAWLPEPADAPSKKQCEADTSRCHVIFLAGVQKSNGYDSKLVMLKNRLWRVGRVFFNET